MVMQRKIMVCPDANALNVLFGAWPRPRKHSWPGGSLHPSAGRLPSAVGSRGLDEWLLRWDQAGRGRQLLASGTGIGEERQGRQARTKTRAKRPKQFSLECVQSLDCDQESFE